MRIVIVSATALEVQPLLQHYALQLDKHHTAHFTTSSHACTIMITGVGMVNTARQFSKHLATLPLIQNYDLAINVGICGSYNAQLTLTQVVQIAQDAYSDLGAEDGDNFIPLSQMGFPLYPNAPKPQYPNTITNPNPITGLQYNNKPIALCTGITVNTVHGNTLSIQKAQHYWQADTESMEGAAFFQVCTEESIPFIALRAISNRVEPRNLGAWQVKEAIAELNNALSQVLMQL